MSTTPTIERTVPPWAAGTETRLHELNPELTDAQLEIVRGYGNEVSFEAGDWLWRTGERDAGFFLVLDGEVEIVNRRSEQECIIITHGRGHYGGETVTMTGRGALVGGRAKGAVKAIALSPRRLREMIALEAELGEMILLSFILRRMRMIAEVQGDVTLLGVDTESASAHLHSFLSRHGIPHEFRDVRATDTAEALAKAQVTADDRPVVVTNRGVLVRPSIRQLAEHLEIADHVDENARFDVAVLGGGPAGLAAAVYGASEGLSVIVIDNFAPGGQAAT